MNETNAEKLILAYLSLMEKCGRSRISEAELMTFIGVDPLSIPIDAHDIFYTLGDTYRKKHGE